MHYVYIVSFLDCGVFYTYYGITSQYPPCKRWRNGKAYLGQSKKFKALHNPLFLSGCILGRYSSKSKARAEEKKLTNVNKNRPNGLNSYT